MKGLVDSYNRTIDYMRISVTDRCNLRCVYCMPPEGISPMPHEDILTYEEIIHITSISAELGIKKVRLTGGEPLVRKDLPYLIRHLRALNGIVDIGLTTNGVLLSHMAHQLREAGLQRVNVSLDSLDPRRYSQVTRGGRLSDVWDGLIAAKEARLDPIKINMVPIEGLNSDEIIPFAELTLKWPFAVRFIEWMPVGGSQPWRPEAVIWGQDIIQVLQGSFTLLPDTVKGNGPAEVFRIKGGRGTIGIIRPISRHFCNKCNRLRLTPDGRLRTCLFSEIEMDLKALIRSGASDSQIKRSILSHIRSKPRGHGLDLQDGRVKKCMRPMNRIGG